MRFSSSSCWGQEARSGGRQPVIFLWGYHAVWGVSKAINWKPAPDEIDRYYEATPA